MRYNVKHGHQEPQVRIRPLSEGIGLGNLRSVTPQVRPSNESSASNFSATRQDVSVARQAQVAYAPHSVATQLRHRQTTRWYVGFWRFFAGVGADIFVGSTSVFILAWAGVLAWNAGSSGEFNPLSALITITDVLERFSALRVGLFAVSVAIVWRTAKILLQPQASV
jgi:hypothetical protein